ncbi:uncharacterized protein C22orf15 homolog [Sorex fumeus]|uniref:uncharacterized protein C22orf15 homolog n=1 Tax=Sorex fumeus TaxID=62283 RepID=UPI0024ADB756|nr:uncharacterized protein C22orf15 homolog [Sorex fumeus]
MFVTVMFGAGCRELVNPWCNLVTLKTHLKQRGQVPPDATIALLAEDGHLVSLSAEEGASEAPTMGSSLLQERGTYILVQVIMGEGGAPTRYESLLENLEDSHPELAEELRWLSGLPSLGEARRRRAGARAPLAESGLTKKLHQQDRQAEVPPRYPEHQLQGDSHPVGHQPTQYTHLVVQGA